jgi:DegV family protein with EDD domain
MAEVKIVADSSVCLPRELIEKYGILLVPEKIIFGNKIYRDGMDLDPRDQRAIKEADSIICILVTSGFSSMGLKSALIARESFPKVPIEVIDSRTAVGAYGFVVLAAARAAAESKPLPEVVKAAEDMKERVNMIATLDTLKYLEKGGRIGKAACWAGSLLSIKPIIEVPTSSGVVEPLERVRTRRRALKRLLQIMKERVNTEPVHVNIDHANVPDDADWLKTQVSSHFNCNEIYINDWAPVAGVHCGPGVIGLSFYTGN